MKDKSPAELGDIARQAMHRPTMEELEALGELVLAASDKGELIAELERWKEWSDNFEPSDEPGDVIGADVNGIITLDRDRTAWDPLRGLKFAFSRIGSLRVELDAAKEEAADANQRAQRNDESFEALRSALRDVVEELLELSEFYTALRKQQDPSFEYIAWSRPAALKVLENK